MVHASSRPSQRLLCMYAVPSSARLALYAAESHNTFDTVNTLKGNHELSAVNAEGQHRKNAGLDRENSRDRRCLSRLSYLPLAADATGSWPPYFRPPAASPPLSRIEVARCAPNHDRDHDILACTAL
ncbi:hypothetical protein BU26DRAFT_504438 [Trematosphaeria pertusa]|uniref:Uncharacterized protein n=1 Tax=Trematosphaeria pertusa TaxID=390896 RepID=A0A6A6II49_9PLEO|nr:uncharacterized protein BU26DRAFT_504438 [Trematosphaeria pertusa]KAF2250036.1 hypothetical protein BU26DRAFT_504438 [Trematosphaeria pertusa]